MEKTSISCMMIGFKWGALAGKTLWACHLLRRWQMLWGTQDGELVVLVVLVVGIILRAGERSCGVIPLMNTMIISLPPKHRYLYIRECESGESARVYVVWRI